MPRRPRVLLTGGRIVTMLFLLLGPVLIAIQAPADDIPTDSATADSVHHFDAPPPMTRERQLPAGAGGMFILADDLWDAGLRFEAVTLIDSALALYPSSDILWALKGMFDKYLENYEYSLQEYETAIRLAPDDPNYWYFRSNVLQALNRFPEALASADSAIARDRSDVTYWNKRAFLLYWTYRYRESLAATDSAIKYYRETHPFSYDEITKSDLPEGKAIEVWTNGGLQATITNDSVISYGDDTTPFWGVRAGSLMELGRYEEAIEFFDRSLAEDPSATGYWLDRATCLMKIHRFEDAAFSVDSAQKYNEDPEKEKDILHMRDVTTQSVRDSVSK